MTPKTKEAETDTQAQPVQRAGVVMAILFLIFFLGVSDNQMISPLLPFIASDLGVGVGRTGWLMGPAYALAAATAAFLVGPISDKFGRRRFLLYASILFGASLLAVSVITDLRAIAAVRLATGLAAGTFSTCSIAYVADYFPYSRRSTAMSVVQAGYFAALVIGVPIALLLASEQSWRTSFVFFGALSAAAFVAVLALLPEDKHSMAERNLAARVSRRFDNMRVLFEKGDRIASIGAAFCVSCGFVGFMFYLGAWLKNSVGLSPQQIGVFFVLVGVAALIGSVVTGPLANKIGRRGISIISSLVLAAMLLVIPRFGWGVPLFASFLAATLAFTFRQGPLQALATELVPAHARGALVAVRNTASQIGIAVSMGISGWLFDHYGYWTVGLFGSIVTIAATAFIALMKEPPQRAD
jgi:predicted MFS family arabinose efflux permease